MTWIGLCKVGVIVAMINSNNKKKTLLHALQTGNCNKMIYGAELEDVVLDVYKDLNNMPIFVSYSGSTSASKSSNGSSIAIG